jgi:ELWxxDGT repeat protein
MLIKAINPDPSGRCPVLLTPIGNKLIFNAIDGSHGDEMWLSDGTTAGTIFVQDILPGNRFDFLGPAGYTLVGSFVFFIANDGDSGSELWAVPVASLGVSVPQIYIPAVMR